MPVTTRRLRWRKGTRRWMSTLATRLRPLRPQRRSTFNLDSERRLRPSRLSRSSRGRTLFMVTMPRKTSKTKRLLGRRRHYASTSPLSRSSSCVSVPRHSLAVGICRLTWQVPARCRTRGRRHRPLSRHREGGLAPACCKSCDCQCQRRRCIPTCSGCRQHPYSQGQIARSGSRPSVQQDGVGQPDAQEAGPHQRTGGRVFGQ